MLFSTGYSALQKQLDRLIIIEAAGVRIAVAVLVPFFVGQLLGVPVWGTMVSLGSLYVAIAEQPGSTLRSMLVATAAVAFAGGIGATFGESTLLISLWMFIIAFGGSLLSAYGQDAGSLGSSVALAFAVSTGLAGSWPAGPERFVQFGIGGLWATLLTIVLWLGTLEGAKVKFRGTWGIFPKKKFHPLYFHHAFRVAIAATAALTLSRLLNIVYGSWVPITVLVILKPDYASTWQRAHERLWGSLIGGGIALFLVGMIHNVYVQDGLLILTSTLAFSHLLRDYRRYALYFTIFIILWKANFTPDDWQIALGRITDTLIGGGVALLIALMLRPISSPAEGNRVDHLFDTVLENIFGRIGSGFAIVQGEINAIRTKRNRR